MDVFTTLLNTKSSKNANMTQCVNNLYFICSQIVVSICEGQLQRQLHQFWVNFAIYRVFTAEFWETESFIMVGDCVVDVDSDCVSSPNHPNVHGNNEECTITMLRDSSLRANDIFSVETCCDHLIIGGLDVESLDQMPNSLYAGTTITWTSDGSVTEDGWSLCFEPTTLSKNTSSQAFW